jgi:hypothetical protein
MRIRKSSIKPVMRFIPPTQTPDLIEQLRADKVMDLVEKHEGDAEALSKLETHPDPSYIAQMKREAETFKGAADLLNDLVDEPIPTDPKRFETLLTALDRMVEIETIASKPENLLLRPVKSEDEQRKQQEQFDLQQQAHQDANTLKEAYTMAVRLAKNLDIPIDSEMARRHNVGAGIAA